MKPQEKKTNAMRILDSLKIGYSVHSLGDKTAENGLEAARLLGLEPKTVFKTLVTVGKSGQHYVYVLPVYYELDLRAAARAVGEKSVEMVKSRELLPLTGYIHGGCSPIGMKKQLRTLFDSSVELLDEVTFSAGRVGRMIRLSVCDIKKALPYETAELTVK